MAARTRHIGGGRFVVAIPVGQRQNGPMRQRIVRNDGSVAIPRALREQANLRAGEPVCIRATEDGLLITAGEERDPDQWWFWTEEWQKGEREVDEAIARGERGTVYLSAHEMEAAFAARQKRE